MSEIITHHRNNEKEEDLVIDAIKKNHMRMHSRWYFVVRAALILIAAVMLALLLLYVVSFIIFALYESGAWFEPAFGIPGWSLFLAALPWGMFILSLVLLVLLANVLRRYAFAYHQPVFIFLLVIILCITMGGFLVAATSFHKGLLEYAEGNVPFLGKFYEREVAFPENVHRGEVVGFTDGGFVIDSGSGITSSVKAANGVIFIGNIALGNVVLVFGERDASGTINAFGIQRVLMAISTGTLR